MAFTSLGANVDETVANNAHGVYSLRVLGEIYHLLGALLPSEGQRPQYAQVYMYDGDDLVDAQMHNVAGLDREVLRLLNNLLRRHNPYARTFKMACERMRVNSESRLHVRMLDPITHDPRRYNRPHGR